VRPSLQRTAGVRPEDDGPRPLSGHQHEGILGTVRQLGHERLFAACRGSTRKTIWDVRSGGIVSPAGRGGNGPGTMGFHSPLQGVAKIGALTAEGQVSIEGFLHPLAEGNAIPPLGSSPSEGRIRSLVDLGVAPPSRQAWAKAGVAVKRSPPRLRLRPLCVPDVEAVGEEHGDGAEILFGPAADLARWRRSAASAVAMPARGQQENHGADALAQGRWSLRSVLSMRSRARFP